MGRLVCFIDAEGQVGTCINFEHEGDCANCEYNDTVHKKWLAELNAQPKHCVAEYSRTPRKDENSDEDNLLASIRKHEVDISINFIDQDIIVCGTAGTDGISVSCMTRCFETDLGCEDYNCLKCPYTDKTKQEAIFNKYEEPVVELLRDIYKKIEAMR